MTFSSKTTLSAPSAILFLFFLPLLTPAQSKDTNDHSVRQTITLFSKILNEDRTIYIQYPKADSTHIDNKYPVFYLLDGESHFDMVAQYCNYLSRPDVYAIPEMILVGIANTSRTRDLTPTSSIINYFGEADTNAISWMKPSGGNERFLQFIREELMPYVESHYKTQPFKIFAGHSFGGIAAINCLLTHPEMFNAYIAVSPSFWWDGTYLLQLADRRLKKGDTLNKFLFCSDASEGIADSSTYHTNLLKFDTLLKKKTLRGLDYQYSYYPKEIHMTEPVIAYYEALRFLYTDWLVHPQKPAQVSASALMTHYQRLSRKYGYTILPDEGNIDNWASWLLKHPETIKNGISLLEMNVSNYPSSVKALTSLARAYEIQGDRQKANEYHQKAGLIKP